MERYKNILLIEVEKTANDFKIGGVRGLSGEYIIEYSNDFGDAKVYPPSLPSGNYTIVGKGDEVGMKEIPSFDDGMNIIKTINSKGMKPSTTLILLDNSIK